MKQTILVAGIFIIVVSLLSFAYISLKENGSESIQGDRTSTQTEVASNTLPDYILLEEELTLNDVVTDRVLLYDKVVASLQENDYESFDSPTLLAEEERLKLEGFITQDDEFESVYDVFSAFLPPYKSRSGIFYEDKVEFGLLSEERDMWVLTQNRTTNGNSGFAYYIANYKFESNKLKLDLTKDVDVFMGMRQLQESFGE